MTSSTGQHGIVKKIAPYFPSVVKESVKNVLRKYEKSIFRIKHRCQYTNIYHCALHKTGSQWILQIMADPRTFQYCGLTHFHYESTLPGKADPRRLTDRSFDAPFPKRTIVTPLFIDHGGFQKIQKPHSYRAFVVIRDPRDLVVSWYFYMRHVDINVGMLMTYRSDLNKMEKKEGLEYSIRALDQNGTFQALRSWISVPQQNPNVLLIRYEDIIGIGQLDLFRKIFRHCDIPMPDPILEKLLADYSFESLAGGRKKGQENSASHYRKGTSGDWMNHFTPAHTAKFKEVTGDLVPCLGYSW